MLLNTKFKRHGMLLNQAGLSQEVCVIYVIWQAAWEEEWKTEWCVYQFFVGDESLEFSPCEMSKKKKKLFLKCKKKKITWRWVSKKPYLMLTHKCIRQNKLLQYFHFPLDILLIFSPVKCYKILSQHPESTDKLFYKKVETKSKVFI